MRLAGSSLPETLAGLVGGKAPPEVITEEFVVQEASEANGHKALRMRVYRNEPRRSDQQLPCVVCIHGTAYVPNPSTELDSRKRRFYGGRFDDDPLLLPRVTKNVIVLCEHRGSREGGRFPQALQDVAACVRHLRANAAELGLDPGRIAIFGESSGGYMATMLCALSANKRPDLLGELGEHPTVSAEVSCAVALYPPTKFEVMDQQHDPNFHAQIHDSPESPEAHFLGFPVQSRAVDHASPLTYVTPETPPIFLAHGTCDPLVPCGQSRLLFEHLVSIAAKPNNHQYHELVGAGHSTAHFSDDALGHLVFDFLDAFNEPPSSG